MCSLAIHENELGHPFSTVVRNTKVWPKNHHVCQFWVHKYHNPSKLWQNCANTCKYPQRSTQVCIHSKKFNLAWKEEQTSCDFTHGCHFEKTIACFLKMAEIFVQLSCVCLCVNSVAWQQTWWNLKFHTDYCQSTSDCLLPCETRYSLLLTTPTQFPAVFRTQNWKNDARQRRASHMYVFFNCIRFQQFAKTLRLTAKTTKKYDYLRKIMHHLL